MDYNYIDGKDRIKEILNNNAEIIKTNVPKDDNKFTYDNGIRSWIGSIFVDIVKSSRLIKEENELIVSKILRAFTSEIISILNSSNNVREIGIRGDCVYGVFSAPKTTDTYELYQMTTYINCFIKMLNKMLTKKKYRTIQVGIGMSIGEDLIVKAGQKGTGINDKIWIGQAVVDACNLANIAGRNGKGIIGYSKISYDNFIQQVIEQNKNYTEDYIKSWFNYDANKNAYFANIINIKFDEWIQDNL